jgi:hypothetical protein
MKKISVLLALAAFFFADLALAGAVATSVTGTVGVQTGTAGPRVLRQGDQVNKGDTVFTGGSSSVVLRFDDGQIAALTSNSRMQVTSYQFNRPARSGNVLLSLISGGMRAITGLLGHANPDQVSYRAATATLGIRGTDVDITVGDNIVAASVNEGSITFTFNGTTVIVSTGQAVFGTNGQITPGAAQDVFNKLPQDLRDMFVDLNSFTNRINDALSQGGNGEGNQSGTNTTPSSGTQPASTGGSNASTR